MTDVERWAGRGGPRRLRSWFHRRLVYPATVRLRGEQAVFTDLAQLKLAERLTPEELHGRQRGLLAAQLNFAKRHCEYYSARWGASQAFSSLDNPETALNELPFLTKGDLQEHFEDLVARPTPSRVSRKTTGGSTGQPVTVLKDSRALAWERAASWLGYGWYGVRPGDRGVRFWGSPGRPSKRLARFVLADLAMNRKRFSAFAFQEEDLDEYWDQCLRIRPDYFYGYTSMLEALARHVLDRSGQSDELRLKCVITTAEVLSESQRVLLQEAFRAPVQDEYGCGEVGAIAYECEKQRFHLMSENVYVELLRQDGGIARSGEMGEVVVTDLRNRAMPLIRYRLGDFAAWGDTCDCGRGFPTLLDVMGREYDFVLGPDGSRYHGEFWMYLFEDLRDSGVPIGQFKVVQLEPLKLEIQLETSAELTADHEERMRGSIARELPGVVVDLRLVREIGRARSGKMRVVESRLRPR